MLYFILFHKFCNQMNENNFLYAAAQLLAPESPLISQSLMQKLTQRTTPKLTNYCLHCKAICIPSVNCFIAIQKKNQVIKCNYCGKVTRIPLCISRKTDIAVVKEDSKPLSKKTKKRKDLSALLKKQPTQSDAGGFDLSDFLGGL